jgi:phosphatidylethanolamine/phosphatidyl-N-methylethanolamine N-methyltransferase
MSLRDSFKVLRTFVRHPLRTGAVLPSSPYLSRALVAGLDLKPGDLVLEYGPGTGPITKVLQERLQPGVRYLGIERDPGFHRLLVQRFPDLDFHLGSVEDVSRILEDRDLPAPRVIVSGLPFASLPPSVQDRIIEGTKSILPKDGEFRTFQYVHAYRLPAALRFRKIMTGCFSEFRRIGPIFRNVPPAYVLAYRP